MRQVFKNGTFLVLFSFISIVTAYFESCDQQINLGAYETYALNSPGYPRYGWMPGSSCRYVLTAPQGYQIDAKCYLNVPSVNMNNQIKCTTENFFIFENSANSGNPIPYCGNGNIDKSSVNNQLVVAYTSTSNDKSGQFNCVLKTTPQTCDCGWNMNTRIVGGQNAKQNEFPPMVGLKNIRNNITFCGGTIISPWFVLSAAHCFNLYNVYDVNIVVGEVNLLVDNSPFFNQYYIQQVYINPEYKRGGFYNDIALAQTGSQMIWSRGVGPACLPIYNTFASFANAQVEATGWGTLSFGGPRSNILQKVTIKVDPNSDCKSKFYSDLIDSQMCTYTNGKDSCQYDSGGPIFYSGGRLFVVGVVSYGDACGTDKPSVNTRVTSFIPWILSKTGTLCQKPIR